MGSFFLEFFNKTTMYYKIPKNNISELFPLFKNFKECSMSTIICLQNEKY